MTPKELQRIRAFDLKRIAYHEAGHLVVLRALGGAGDIRIWFDSTANPETTRLFRGQVRILQPPATDDHMRAVNMAGVVAESLVDDDDPDAYEIFSYIEDDIFSMSESDASLGITLEAVTLALEILAARWPEVKRLALDEIYYETTE